MLKEKAIISKPKRCEDCPCFHHDSDEGGKCGYSYDRVSYDTSVTEAGLKGVNCIFKNICEL